VLFLPRGRGSVADLKLERAMGLRLIVGLWGSAGAMGRVLATSMIPTLYLFLESRQTGKRRFLLAGMLAAEGYSLLICMCRAPWLAAIAALFVLQFFDLRVRKLFIVILIAGAIFLPLTWDRVSDSNVAARINDENSTYEGREARWQAGFRMWLAKPIRGWGFGRYELEAWRFRTGEYSGRLSAPENDYLVVVIGSGLLGLLPYLGVFLVPLWYSLRLIWQHRAYKRLEQAWPGFVKPEALGVAIAMIAGYLVFSWSAANVIAGTKLIILTMLGAVVGSHEHLLRRPKDDNPALAKVAPPGDANPSLTTQGLNI
jgi:O-antigen ligase